jgi:hypothetical protein
MADDKKDAGAEGHDAMKDVYFFLLCLAVLVGAWWYMGGPEKTDMRGIFLRPPAPIDTGEAYGPQIPSPIQDTTEPAEGAQTQ